MPFFFLFLFLGGGGGGGGGASQAIGEYTTNKTMPSGNIFISSWAMGGILLPQKSWSHPEWYGTNRWVNDPTEIMFFFSKRAIIQRSYSLNMIRTKKAIQSNLCVILTIYQAFSFLHFYVMAIRPRDGNANNLYEIQTGVCFVQNYKISIHYFGTAIRDQSLAIVNSSWNID